MQFEYTDPQTEFEKLVGGHFHINAFGRIESGDHKKFLDFLSRTQPPPRISVYINSLGGDVDAAIGIGRTIRDWWFSTSIGTYALDHGASSRPILSRNLIPGKCMSAATLSYLGGRLRYFPEGSEFGIHQFSFRNPSPNDVGHSQMLSARVARFVADMGVRQEFLELSSSTPSDSIRLVSMAELQKMGIVTGGVTDVQWSVHARAKILYVKGERDSLFGHHKVMLCYAKGVGFLFWSVIESQGRERELVGFRVVQIVVNEEDVRIDISGRCNRLVNGIYVNILAQITQEEAKLLAYSESFGLQIRFSTEAPVFFGASAMSTDGGRDQLETFFEALCD